MNLPNQLTVARLWLTLAFVTAFAIDWRFSYTAALVLFLLASATDYLDGEIARRYKMETDFGALMDPLMDKVLMAAAFICLVAERALPAWVAIVIISREFLITGLRLLATNKNIVLPAERMGKHKTIWQVVTIIFFLGLLSIKELDGLGLLHTGMWWWFSWQIGGTLLLIVTLVLTLLSGLGYLWKSRALIAEK